MYKYLFIVLALLSTYGFAANSNGGEVQVRACMHKIWQLPEAKKLINEIQKEGPIHFASTDHDLAKKFGAFWDVDQRIICVNPAFHNSEGEMIGSILFEMQNALATPRLNEIYALAEGRQIDKETYIRSMEYVEYTNSKKAAAMADRGIELGIFPKSARMHTYKDFDEHLYWQKVGGHSEWFANAYDQLSVQ